MKKVRVWTFPAQRASVPNGELFLAVMRFPCVCNSCSHKYANIGKDRGYFDNYYFLAPDPSGEWT